eukprot:288816_1
MAEVKKKVTKLIKRVMTPQMQCPKRVIYWHENHYHLAKLAYLSLKHCHVNHLNSNITKSTADLRIIWNNVFLIERVGNVDNIQDIMASGRSIEGYLAMNAKHKRYERVYSVETSISNSNDVNPLNRVKFQGDEDWVDLDEYVNIQNEI